MNNILSINYFQSINYKTKTIVFDNLMQNIDTTKSFIRFYLTFDNISLYNNIFSIINNSGIITNCYCETENNEINNFNEENLKCENINYNIYMLNALSNFYANFDTKVIMKNAEFKLYNHAFRKKILSCKIPLSILTCIKSNNFSYSKIAITLNDNYLNLLKSKCKLTLHKSNIIYKKQRFIKFIYNKVYNNNHNYIYINDIDVNITKIIDVIDKITKKINKYFVYYKVFKY